MEQNDVKDRPLNTTDRIKLKYFGYVGRRDENNSEKIIGSRVSRRGQKIERVESKMGKRVAGQKDTQLPSSNPSLAQSGRHLIVLSFGSQMVSHDQF